MKKFILILGLFLTSFVSFATHTKGGWMYYEYLGQGITDPAKLRYKIVLKIYMICDAGPGQLDLQVNFSFFDGQSNNWVQDIRVGLAQNPTVSNCTLKQCNPCIFNIPGICYMIATYEAEVELVARPGGYTVAYQRCCRISGIVNVNNSNSVGDTWLIKIPGTSNLATAPQNSSPQFIANDTAIVCAENTFEFNFTATDIDGDSLTYEFAQAYSGGSSGNPSPTTASKPPFVSIPYRYPFTAVKPLGESVTINASSGVVSGTAPTSGVYVLTVKVKEYRKGIYIGEAQKSLHIQVADCFPIKATLNPTYITCDGFSLTFSNETPNSNIQAYLWEFDDPNSGALNSSASSNPTHEFTDTGIYKIKLFVNLGLSCSDSTISEVKVYPGFYAGFRSRGQCVNSPIQFTDTSKTKFGFVDKWLWNFGDGSTLADTSHLQNPNYTYKTPGTYNIQLTVSNILGCTKTTSHSITIIDNPTVTTSFSDSSYCGNDTLQLKATANASGSFSWAPNNFILQGNSANPSVFPKANTQYIVTFDAGGCLSKDTVHLNPKFDFAVDISASKTNICEADTITLSATPNYTTGRFRWSPSSTLNSANTSVTNAFPVSNTTYTVTSKWGNNCMASASVPVTVKSLVQPNAGDDVFFCKNSPGVMLNATGGTNFKWSPSTGLSDPDIANPIANPTETTSYIVSSETAGCEHRKEDTVIVTLMELPELTLTNDTLICSIDTLQLNAISPAAVKYSWSPAYHINNITSASPFISPDVPTQYMISVSDTYQCESTDSVWVDVKTFVSLNAGNDTTICQGDPMVFKPISDALSYSWSPDETLNSGTIKDPQATPLQTTTYTVIGNIGKCQDIDEITVNVVPYPKAYAGSDAVICADSSVTLQASGGSSFVWAPATFLSNSNSANPVSKPGHDMQYIVTVTENAGCPKGVNDTVFIKVLPAIVANAGVDTVAVTNQPVQLYGSGGDIYTWWPATGLNDPNIANPVATLNENQEYILTTGNAAGCSAKDTVNIVVYKVDAGMYVPNAFSPNGDGVNDLFRPIPIGIKTFLSFRVYDRLGSLIFSTSTANAGWDGTFKGKPLDQDVFVWTVEGIDYENNKISKRGSVMLIR